MKILMVCMGNICRSPLAEGIMKSKMKQYGIEGEVDSAGTISAHKGEAPDHRSCEIAMENGIDITDQRARPFRESDFDAFDRIFVMDKENYSNIIKIAATQEQRQKVELIMNRLRPGSNVEVPDPYYGGRPEFVKVFQMLDATCEAIAKSMT